MPLYRRLPKRGFNPIPKSKKIAILNLEKIQYYLDKKKIDSKSTLDLKLLQQKKLLRKNYNVLKILGKGEIKSKIEISANFFSKQAEEKIKKIGGKSNINKI